MRLLAIALLSCWSLTGLACLDAGTQSRADVVFPDAGVSDTDPHDDAQSGPPIDPLSDAATTGDASGGDAAVEPSDWEGFDAGPPAADLDEEPTIGPDDRLARVLVPDDYDGTDELPVIFLLHGYTATAATQDTYFDLSPKRHDRQFILVLPDGLTDTTGQQFWNATDYCCDFYGEDPDDVAYIEGLLDELLVEFAADPDRIHLMGYSNGAFLANRLACEMGSRVASLVGLAGTSHWDPDDCPEDGELSVLHIHGTNDAVIFYSGVLNTYPGARTLTDRWSRRNRCSETSSIDGYTALDSLIWGAETSQRAYRDCPADIDVELWSIIGGSHTPLLNAQFTESVLDFALPRTNPDTAPE